MWLFSGNAAETVSPLLHWRFSRVGRDSAKPTGVKIDQTSASYAPI